MAANRHFRKEKDAINGYLHECSQLLPLYNNIYITPPIIKDICAKYYCIPFVPSAEHSYNHNLLFKFTNIRAYRWDPLLNKWRGRGTGILTIYHIIDLDVSKLIFFDEKHQKVRLFQYIDGTKYSKFHQDDIRCLLGYSMIVWDALDYTIDTQNPLIGTWQIRFQHKTEANKFFKIYNQSINNFNKETLISSAPVPLLYKCFICNTFGKHWMFHCVDFIQQLINNKEIYLWQLKDEKHNSDLPHLTASLEDVISSLLSNFPKEMSPLSLEYNVNKKKRVIWKARRRCNVCCKICNENTTNTAGLADHIRAKHGMETLADYYGLNEIDIKVKHDMINF
eukprot:4600_1